MARTDETEADAWEQWQAACTGCTGLAEGSLSQTSRTDAALFALRALLHPALRPFLFDPTRTLDGQFPSLDAHAFALLETPSGQNAARFLGEDDRAALRTAGLGEFIPGTSTAAFPLGASVGAIWAGVYLPAAEKAAPCRIIAQWAGETGLEAWPEPKTLRPVSEALRRTGRVALAAALAALRQSAFVVPPDLQMRGLVWDCAVPGVPDVLESTHGNSLHLPLALVFLSLLTNAPIAAQTAATGTLGANADGEVCVLPVGFAAEKAEALRGVAARFLVPDASPAPAFPFAAPVCDLVEAAALAGLLKASPPQFINAAAPADAFRAALCVVFDAAGAEQAQRYVRQILARFGASDAENTETNGEICAAFDTPKEAFEAAQAIRHALRCAAPWPLPATPPGTAPAFPIPVLPRMGVRIFPNEGSVEEGITEAARLALAAHHGQILVRTEESVSTQWPDTLTVLGRFRFWDLAPPVLLHTLQDGRHGRNPEPAAPQNALHSRRHNLPIEPLPLVGCTNEIGEITRLLTGPSPHRLVSITGGVGMGKTRLALECAARTGAFWSGGIWFVPAGDAQTEDDLAARIAETVGVTLSPNTKDASVTETPSAPLALRLLRCLREANAPTLLVLDSNETVPPALAVFAARVMAEASGVCVLAASRTALAVPGEAVFVVNPLDAPASRLFFAARAARPPQNGDGEFLPAICQAAGGIPSVLLLLGAQTAFLPYEQIARSLRDLLPEPSGDTGHATVSPARRLRQTLRFIYDTLTEDEQTALRRASVLTQKNDTEGWTTEAAAAVSGLPPADARDAVETLLARGFFVRGQNNRLLCPLFISDWAGSLQEKGDEAAQPAHAAYFARSVQEKGLLWDTPTETEAFDILHSERFQLCAAADFLHDRDRAAFIAFAANTGDFLHYRGMTKQWQEWPRRAVRLVEMQTRPADFAYLNKDDAALFARLYRFCATACLSDGDAAGAKAYVNTGLVISRAAQNARDTADLLNLRGLAERRNGNGEAALSDWSEARTWYEGINNRRGIVTTLNNTGAYWERQQNHDAARACYEEALQIGRRIHDRRGLSYTLTNLGCNAYFRRRGAEAQAYFGEYLQIARELKDAESVARAALNLGDTLHTLQKDTRRAAPFLALAQQIFVLLASPLTGEADDLLASLPPAYSAEIDFLRRDFSRRSLPELLAYPLMPPRTLTLPDPEGTRLFAAPP